MTDAELTALAAKAFCDAPVGFSPLIDDGDVLRLAVALSLNVDRCPDDVGRYVRAWRPGTEMIAAPVSVVEEFEAKGDPYAATRRAIVRAAAEIGRQHD